jgi:hypothetical protein
MKWPGATEELAMTTMGKTLFVALSLAGLIGGTLALRSEPDPVPEARLTAAQVAELQPAAKPPDPPKAVRAPADAEGGDPAEPPDLQIEDGSGS